MGIIGIEGNADYQLQLLREATAWTVLAEAHEDLRAGNTPRHDAREIYTSRYRLAEARGITELEAWHMVGRESTLSAAQ